MAVNSKCPALIDPPAPDAPLAEWLDYREDLRRSGLPGLWPFVREADAIIARLRRATGKLDKRSLHHQ
jgi:hypothetical protein